MAYSAIANSEIDGGSPITEPLMTKIRDNIDDHTHGHGLGDGPILDTWTHIQTNDITSAVATSDFSASFDSTYDIYMLVAKSINVSSNGAGIYLRFETGGATWQTSGYLATTTHIPFIANIGSGAGRSGDGRVYIYKPTAAEHTRVTISAAATNSSGAVIGAAVDVALYASTTAVTGIRAYPNAGNINSGVISIYGLKYRGT